MKNYLVQFNNGFESAENDLAKVFDTLKEAKEYAKENCEVYYNISEGEYITEDGLIQGSGNVILSNCTDTSITWFYNYNANFCPIEEL